MSVTATRLLSRCVTSHHSRSDHFSDQTAPVMLTGEVFCLISRRCDGLSSASKLPQWDVKGHTKYGSDLIATKKCLQQIWKRHQKVKALFLLAGLVLKENKILLRNWLEKTKSRTDKLPNYEWTFLWHIIFSCHKKRGQPCVTRSKAEPPQSTAAEHVPSPWHQIGCRCSQQLSVRACKVHLRRPGVGRTRTATNHHI